MRAVFLASVPSVLLVSGLFFACGGGAVTGADDGGKDAEGKDAPIDVPIDLPQTGDAGLLCSIMKTPAGGMEPLVDPVAYCIERSIISDQHAHFNAKTGVLTAWDYGTEVYTPVDGGPPPHDLHDDVAYASSLTDFYQWSHLYADAPDFEGGGTVEGDLLALAPLIEKELSPLPSDCDGELYFNLRNFSLGLKVLEANDDAAKIDAIAFAYAKQIYANCYFPLPLAGAGGDAGAPDAGAAEAGAGEGGAEAGPSDAGAPDVGPGGDPGAMGDGIIGVQTTKGGGTAVLYEPDQVVTAAYALFELATVNGTDPSAGQWILAARQSLDHVYGKARDSESGLYHASLLTTGGKVDALGDRTSPADLLPADVQATIALYLIRSYELLLTFATAVDSGIDSPDVIVPLDAALMGPLASVGHLPLLKRADEVIAAMNALWDGALPVCKHADAGSHFDGGKQGNGYLDGLVPSTHKLVATKSTRPNAYMFAAMYLDVRYEGKAALCPVDRLTLANDLRELLTGYQTPGEMISGAGMSTSFLNVVSVQTGYFDTVSAGFQLLAPQTSTSAPQNNYTSAAAAAAFAGFNEQLVGLTP